MSGLPVFSASTDALWQAAWWLGVGTLVMTLALLVLILLLKRASVVRQAREQAFEARWQPWLIEAALGEAIPTPSPPMGTGDDWRLLKLWVRFMTVLRGRARDRLRQIGHDQGLSAMAQRLLRSQHRSQQLFGLLALGHLRHANDWDAVAPLLAHPSHTVALHAGWALLGLDPDRAAPRVVELLLQRREVDVMQVSSLLKPYRQILHAALSRDIEVAGQLHIPAQQDPQRLAWLLRLAHAMALPLNPSALLSMLGNYRDTDVLSGVLRLVRHPDCAPAVRSLVSHADWQVRTQVAVALGRLGDVMDVPHLLRLLSDPQWWVRYRAAQALVRLPGLSRSDLQAHVAAITDRYARDMVWQVFAEVTGEAP